MNVKHSKERIHHCELMHLAHFSSSSQSVVLRSSSSEHRSRALPSRSVGDVFSTLVTVYTDLIIIKANWVNGDVFNEERSLRDFKITSEDIICSCQRCGLVVSSHATTQRGAHADNPILSWFLFYPPFFSSLFHVCTVLPLLLLPSFAGLNWLKMDSQPGQAGFYLI